MLSLLLFNRVYRLEIQSVMLVFSTTLVYCCPPTFSLTFPPPPLPKVNIQYIQTVCGCWGRWWGVLSCVVDLILEEYNTLFLTRFRTYKFSTPSQAKMTSKDDIQGLVSLKFHRPWWFPSGVTNEIQATVERCKHVKSRATTVYFRLGRLRRVSTYVQHV